MLAIASRALGVCVQTAGKDSQNFLLPLGIAFLWRFENHNIEIYSNYVASAHYINCDVDNIVGLVFDIG